jgi:hypothetical protein
MVFANGTDGATWFGISLRDAVRLLRLCHYGPHQPRHSAHGSWTAAAVDVAWGSFVTGVAAALGLIIADFILPRT